MKPLDEETFICIDCETTGLEPAMDRVIEVAAVTFTFHRVLETFESLVDPECLISISSMEIHHISDDMVKGKPKFKEVYPEIMRLVDRHIIIGHGIKNDIAFLTEEAKRANLPCSLSSHPYIDTLRMARLYGESPTNSLETLRQHFNIASEGAHRAMSDVVVNIEVFKYLSGNFKTVNELMQRLEKPIQLKVMPLGKHKGRPFSEIPLDYLQWAAHKDFDQDLLFSIRTELKKRKKGTPFKQAANPFSSFNFSKDD